MEHTINLKLSGKMVEIPINNHAEKFNERITKMLMEDCEMSKTEISITSKREALQAILEYEGFIGYTDWIISLVEDIYDVYLED